MAVCNGAQILCSFGTAPGTLVVLPDHQALTSKAPWATIMDHKPMVNIMPFAMCMSMANPAVAAATAAAFGVLTPQPCIPATAAPWTPGIVTVMIGKLPALNDSSKCLCSFGGVIQVVYPGQIMTLTP
jgi:hypothetical protein